MNKKGFTVVELIVSFALTMSIATLLFQIVINLKDIYMNSITKTELLNKQSLLSNEINKSFNENEIYNVVKCGTYCLNFIYNDNTSQKLIVDKDEKSISFGSYKTKLTSGSDFGNVNIDIIYAPSFQPYFTDAILNINIPIFDELFDKQNFGINVVYQFDKDASNIYNVDFSDDGNNYGYIRLNGFKTLSINSNQEYIDEGYKIYTADGVEISGSTVIVNNPFSSMSVPYNIGNYEITYTLYDDNNQVVQIIKRMVNVIG